jgi:HD-GYP domain-containing protein (c-di-GMP phosphodiesterase class II)
VGEKIPMQARIVSVADTYDAMTTTRPYQKAMELDYVVERIRQFSGVRYDPVVVTAFLRAYEKGDLAPIPVTSFPIDEEEPLREAL